MADKKQQPFDIGNLKRFKPHIALHHQSAPVEALRLFYDSHRGLYTPFPPDTKAFLYYFTSPEKPRIAGELRLRVAPSDDPASFESGSDLLIVNRQPWSRSLVALSKHYIPLYEKLREERLIPDDLHAALSTFPPKSPRKNRTQLLYTLNDPFIVNFSMRDVCLSIISEQRMETLVFGRPFADKNENTRRKPYTGAYTNHHL